MNIQSIALGRRGRCRSRCRRRSGRRRTASWIGDDAAVDGGSSGRDAEIKVRQWYDRDTGCGGPSTGTLDTVDHNIKWCARWWTKDGQPAITKDKAAALVKVGSWSAVLNEQASIGRKDKGIGLEEAVIAVNAVVIGKAGVCICNGGSDNIIGSRICSCNDGRCLD